MRVDDRKPEVDHVDRVYIALFGLHLKSENFRERLANGQTVRRWLQKNYLNRACSKLGERYLQIVADINHKQVDRVRRENCLV